MQRAAIDTSKLIALRISNGALASAPNLPTRLKLLNWGTNETVKGPVKLGDKSVQVLAANQKQSGFEEVALDFEHNTVPGTPEYDRTKEPRSVAAYGAPVLIPGDGLYLENLRYTPAGKTDALNFADLSPAVLRDESGEVTFLHSVALTRHGAVHELSFFSAGSAGVQPAGADNPSDKSMNQPETFTVAELATALGLKADATKTDALAKFTALSALDARVKAIEALSAGSAGVQPASLTALTARLEKLETAAKESATAADTAERGRLIERFAAEGKVPLKPDGLAYSNDELKALSADTLRMLLANAPVTVPLHTRGVKPTAEGKTEPRPARDVWNDDLRAKQAA